MRTLSVLLLLSGVALAKEPKRGSKAEVRADYALICNALERSGAAKEKDPGKKAQLIADYLLSHIATTQAMSVMQSMGAMLPEDKPASLKNATRQSGYTGDCPLADEK